MVGREILSVIEEGKSKFPEDYNLNISEYNFWYAKMFHQFPMLYPTPKYMDRGVHQSQGAPLLTIELLICFDSLLQTCIWKGL